MDVVQTERALARLAVEVDMSVMMVALALFLAQFVVEYATSVLKGMHHIMLQEQGECTEYARFVHRWHQGFHVAKAHWGRMTEQSLVHQYPVGCRFDAFSCQLVCSFLTVHLFGYCWVTVKI